MDALQFIEAKKTTPPQPIYVLAGDERFLKRLAQSRIQTSVLGENADEFGRTVYEGDAAEWASVRDELDTLPFASARRLVVVQDADPFITNYRDKLEKYLERPSGTGVLVLDVKSWPKTTRLAKALSGEGLIECNGPKQLPPWCAKWALAHYGKKLDSAAAGLLVDLVGSDMGVLDQEIAKLTSYVGEASQIRPDDVDLLVGHSRMESSFQMLDAAAEGNLGRAMTILNRLFEQGEEPVGIVSGPISWQVRKLAQVARLCRQGTSLQDAMSRAAMPPFKQNAVREQLRTLGPRSAELFDWLLEADRGLKSSGGLPPRLVIERLLIKLAGK